MSDARSILRALRARRLPKLTATPEEGDLMLLSVAKRPFSADGWIYELKYDGFRVLAFRDDAGARLLSRLGNDLSPAFPEVVDAVAELPVDVVLDGELTVCDEHGRPQFQQVRTRARARLPNSVMKAMRAMPAMLYAFDVVGIGGYDVRALPLLRRKEMLLELLEPGPHLRPVWHVERDGESLFRQVAALGVEGIVAKRADSAYVAGRSPDWIKVRAPGARPQHRH